MTPALGAEDDMFGPPRCGLPRPERPKPSMISAKLRAKEERKRVIRICTDKLEKIKDPDRNLRRSVCINNTYFRLQDEVRREKRLKHAAPAPEPVAPAAPAAPARTLHSALESIDRELGDIGASPPAEPALEPQPAPPAPPAPRRRPRDEGAFSCLPPACKRARADEDLRRRRARSEFEIILDALRLDDGKELCDRLLGAPGHDSCGQAAFLADAPFHGLLASLET